MSLRSRQPTFGDLNGQDFWRNHGRIDHVRFTEPPQAEKERLRFATECRLLAADGATLGSLSKDAATSNDGRRGKSNCQ